MNPLLKDYDLIRKTAYSLLRDIGNGKDRSVTKERVKQVIGSLQKTINDLKEFDKKAKRLNESLLYESLFGDYDEDIYLFESKIKKSTKKKTTKKSSVSKKGSLNKILTNIDVSYTIGKTTQTIIADEINKTELHNIERLVKYNNNEVAVILAQTFDFILFKTMLEKKAKGELVEQILGIDSNLSIGRKYISILNHITSYIDSLPKPKPVTYDKIKQIIIATINAINSAILKGAIKLTEAKGAEEKAALALLSLIMAANGIHIGLMDPRHVARVKRLATSLKPYISNKTLFGTELKNILTYDPYYISILGDKTAKNFYGSMSNFLEIRKSTNIILAAKKAVDKKAMEKIVLFFRNLERSLENVLEVLNYNASYSKLLLHNEPCSFSKGTLLELTRKHNNVVITMVARYIDTYLVHEKDFGKKGVLKVVSASDLFAIFNLVNNNLPGLIKGFMPSAKNLNGALKAGLFYVYKEAAKKLQLNNDATSLVIVDQKKLDDELTNYVINDVLNPESKKKSPSSPKVGAKGKVSVGMFGVEVKIDDLKHSATRFYKSASKWVREFFSSGTAFVVIGLIIAVIAIFYFLAKKGEAEEKVVIDKKVSAKLKQMEVDAVALNEIATDPTKRKIAINQLEKAKNYLAKVYTKM